MWTVTSKPASRLLSTKLSQGDLWYHPKLRPRKWSVLCRLCLFVGGFSCSSSFLDHTGFVSKTPFPFFPSLASKASISIAPSHSLCPRGPTVPNSTAFHPLGLHFVPDLWNFLFPVTSAAGWKEVWLLLSYISMFYTKRIFKKKHHHVFQLPKICQTQIHSCLLPLFLLLLWARAFFLPPRRNRGKYSRQNMCLSEIPEN